MKSKIEWKQMGQVLAMIVKLFTAVTDVMKKFAVGPEIIEWLVGPGEKFFRSELALMCAEFKKTQKVTHSPEVLAQIKRWEGIAGKILGHAVDYSGVRIPERTAEQAKEFTRLIIVDKDYNQEGAFFCITFPKWKYYNNLDGSITENERDPKKLGTYAIWVRNGVEPDSQHLGKSANDVKAEGLKTETNLERMLHEIVFFAETNGHLDIKGWTWNSGSRRSDGYVPYSYWNGDEFKVDYGSVDGRCDNAGPREVIS